MRCDEAGVGPRLAAGGAAARFARAVASYPLAQHAAALRRRIRRMAARGGTALGRIGGGSRRRCVKARCGRARSVLSAIGATTAHAFVQVNVVEGGGGEAAAELALQCCGEPLPACNAVAGCRRMRKRPIGYAWNSTAQHSTARHSTEQRGCAVAVLPAIVTPVGPHLPVSGPHRAGCGRRYDRFREDRRAAAAPHRLLISGGSGGHSCSGAACVPLHAPLALLAASAQLHLIEPRLEDLRGQPSRCQSDGAL